MFWSIFLSLNLDLLRFCRTAQSQYDNIRSTHPHSPDFSPLPPNHTSLLEAKFRAGERDEVQVHAISGQGANVHLRRSQLDCGSRVHILLNINVCLVR